MKSIFPCGRRSRTLCQKLVAAVGDPEGAGLDPPPARPDPERGKRAQRRQQQARTLLKRLPESDLETLWAAVESRGGSETSGGSACVRVPATLRLGGSASGPQHHYVDPSVLACALFRWPELRLDRVDDDEVGLELMRMPFCRAGEEGDWKCCNPFHWSKVVNIGGGRVKCSK